MVLIRKVTTDTGGITLLETLWKVVEALIDTCLCASLHFYDVLQGFQFGRGTGMAIMELNLLQEISSIDHNFFLLVFFDLRKAYNTVDRDLLI